MNDIKTSIAFPKAKSCSARIDLVEDPNEILHSLAEYVARSKGSAFNPVLLPELVVEEREAIKRPAGWTREAIQDAMELSIAGENVSISDMDFANLLMQYYEKHGPLFKENRISIRQVRQRLIAISFFLWSYANAMWGTGDISKPVLNMIHGSYLLATESYPEHNRLYVVHQMYDEKKDLYYYLASPKAEGDSGFFLKRIALPEKPSRDELQKWCRKQCIFNLNYLLNKHVDVIMGLDKRKGLTLTLRPDDLYTAIILDIVKDSLPPAFTNNETNTKGDVSWDKEQRQRALDKFRTWSNPKRGKITKEEYEELKIYSKKLLGMSKSEIEYELELHLEEIRMKASKKRARKSKT